MTWCRACILGLTWESQHCYRPHTDRAEFWNPRALSYRFLAEAKRLWELERDVDRITTVQAALLLNHVYNMSGADKLGWDYTIQAVRMAQRLNLFKASNDPKGSMKDARDFTAWVVFSWQRRVPTHWPTRFWDSIQQRPPMLTLVTVCSPSCFSTHHCSTDLPKCRCRIRRRTRAGMVNSTSGTR